MMNSATIGIWIMWVIILVSGCSGSVMKSMVGEHNVDSVTLARRCQTDSALTVVKQSSTHSSIVNQSQGLLLQVVYLKDLGRDEEARKLYHKLITTSPWIQSEKELERNAKKALRDLQKMRKRSGFAPDCVTQN